MNSTIFFFLFLSKNALLAILYDRAFQQAIFPSCTCRTPSWEAVAAVGVWFPTDLLLAGLCGAVQPFFGTRISGLRVGSGCFCAGPVARIRKQCFGSSENGQ